MIKKTIFSRFHLSKYMLILVVASAALHAFPVFSQTNEYEGRLKSIATSEIKKWMNTPLIIESIKEQNQKNDILSLVEIEKLDKDWQLQINNINQPLLKKVAEHPLSAFLRHKQEESDGLYREVMVMDNRGLIVGSSITSSDYWQGDEDKWLKTFKVGSGAIFVDEVRYDDSAEAFQAQVSLTISEGDEPLGSITVGIDTEQIEYRNR